MTIIHFSQVCADIDIIVHYLLWFTIMNLISQNMEQDTPLSEVNVEDM